MKQKARKPWLAALFNFLFPGIGYLYCGRVALAVAGYIIDTLLLNAFLLSVALIDLSFSELLLAIAAWVLYRLVIALHAGLKAALSGKDYVLKPYNRWYIYIVVFVIANLCTSYISPVVTRYQGYMMPSESMEDTIIAGDYVFVDHHAYADGEPERRDVVVLLYPVDGVTKYVKRVIGLPGDTVLIVDKRVYINGAPFEEPSTVKFNSDYVRPRGPGGKSSPDNYGPYAVPRDSYFVMGDNRDNSADSRFWGPVPKANILGQAVRVHWSSDRERIGRPVE